MFSCNEIQRSENDQAQKQTISRNSSSGANTSRLTGAQQLNIGHNYDEGKLMGVFNFIAPSETSPFC